MHCCRKLTAESRKRCLGIVEEKCNGKAPFLASSTIPKHLLVEWTSLVCLCQSFTIPITLAIGCTSSLLINVLEVLSREPYIDHCTAKAFASQKGITCHTNLGERS